MSAHLKVRPLKPERERVRRRLIREVGRALRDGRLPPLPCECRARPRPPKQPSEEERERQAACGMPHVIRVMFAVGAKRMTQAHCYKVRKSVQV